MDKHSLVMMDEVRSTARERRERVTSLSLGSNWPRDSFIVEGEGEGEGEGGGEEEEKTEKTKKEFCCC